LLGGAGCYFVGAGGIEDDEDVDAGILFGGLDVLFGSAEGAVAPARLGAEANMVPVVVFGLLSDEEDDDDDDDAVDFFAADADDDVP